MNQDNPFRPPVDPSETGTDEIGRYTESSLLSFVLFFSSIATIMTSLWFWGDGPLKGTLARMLMPAGAIQVGCFLASLLYHSVRRYRST